MQRYKKNIKNANNIIKYNNFIIKYNKICHALKEHLTGAQ